MLVKIFSSFSRRKKMFPHQQMAVPMMPQAHYIANAIWCAYTCAYTCGISCEWSGGGGGCGFYSGGCGFESGGCGRFSPIEATKVEDPVRALEELHKILELKLAGVQAQERLLQERKSAAEKK
jgi:hypothetical protein